MKCLNFVELDKLAIGPEASQVREIRNEPPSRASNACTWLVKGYTTKRTPCIVPPLGKASTRGHGSGPLTMSKLP